MIVVEIYTFQDNYRYVERREYKRYIQWLYDEMILVLQGGYVGYKLWNTDLKTWESWDSVKRADQLAQQKFDKGAYFNGYKKSKRKKKPF